MQRWPIQWRIAMGRGPADDVVAGLVSLGVPEGPQIGLLAASEQKRSAANNLLVMLGKGGNGGGRRGSAAPRCLRSDGSTLQDVCRHGAIHGAVGSPLPISEAGGDSGQVGSCGRVASRAAFLCRSTLRHSPAGSGNRRGPRCTCTAAPAVGERAHRPYLRGGKKILHAVPRSKAGT